MWITIPFLQAIKRFFLELFFPSFCVGCGREGTHLCQDCQAILEIAEYHYCLCNKNPVRMHPGNHAGTCSRCKGKNLSGMYFALAYKEKFLTRKLIYQFKYPPYVKSLAVPLADVLMDHFAMTDSIENVSREGSVLVPVPMEIKKMKDRGYNQSEELTKELSLKLGIPWASNNLVKVKQTLPQMELSALERQENVKDVFVIRNPAEFAGKKIFLVDDVYTTGATMEECAKVLKRANVKEIWGIAIAREE